MSHNVPPRISGIATRSHARIGQSSVVSRFDGSAILESSDGREMTPWPRSAVVLCLALCACGKSGRNSAATADAGLSSGNDAAVGPIGPPPPIQNPKPSEPRSPYIVVDQFGYRPSSEKI